jgi:glucose/arabinose dehydrogenase
MLMRTVVVILTICLASACSRANDEPRHEAAPAAPAASDAGAVGTTGARSDLPAPFATPSAEKFSTVIGWQSDRMPAAPDGFRVSALANGLENPRWLHVLPNGDILVAEAMTSSAPKGAPPEIVDAMKRAKNIGPSANRITLLRDADGDGAAEMRTVLLTGLNQPFGMLYRDGTLYVANTDGLMRYQYKEGQTRVDGAGQKILDLPAGGYNNHWTRNVVARPDGAKLYVSVGSATNVDEEGIDARDPRRAAILEVNPDGTGMRVYASGLRNPNGMDWVPGTNDLWTVVNERDELGDDLVPDYLTRVRDGAFYGWPYAYFGAHEDPRHKGKRPDLVAKAVVPDYPLGAHTASLGLVFYRGDSFPERYRSGAFVAQRGSWNRSQFAGYRVAFVPFSKGRPSGRMEEVLTGFIADEAKSEVYGRPVGLAVLPDGSMLVADDAGGTIWRVTGS